MATNGGRPKVDVVILTIKDEEFEAALSAFSNDLGHYKAPSNRHYNLRLADAGEGHQYRVAIARPMEQGTGAAQDLTRDLLADLAHGVADELWWRGLLFAALLAGSLAGGWTGRRWQHGPVDAAAVLRCLVGGLLMGWGSLLIPGSNDGLILVGLPLAQPHAWLAFSTMCATIAVAMWGQRRRAFRGIRTTRIE